MLICQQFLRIIRNKKVLEEKLGVKIINRGKEITVKGKPEDEYIAEAVINALEFKFPFSVAMRIKEQEHLFEIINIKDHTTKKNLKSVRARIIGKHGKALKTLSNLTECAFELKDNFVGIVGDPEHMKNAQESLIFLIKGSKHSNVYKHLEKHQIKPVIDLGLKE